MALGGSLRDLADRIVHGAQESFVAALTSRLATLLVGLVRGSASSSPARVEVAAALASQTARTEAMAVWAEHSQGVSAEVRREVEASLAREDETLVRSLADEAGGAGLTLTNRGRNDLAEATRGVREVVGRDNVEDELVSRAASAAASAVSRQDATLASTTAEEWYRIAGEAITRTEMGDDPEAVIADAVAELARAGVETVDYRSGVSTTIDAAVRRHVDTQKNQCANDLTVRRCEEWGVGLVCVDAHFGARPSHARWQGKAYSLDGEKTIDGVTYPDLYEATGYQGRNGWPLGDRLAGVNCRHVIYPYVPGVTEIPGDDMGAMEEKYGMSSEEYYRATQRQRSLERRIREKKREVAVGEDQGLDMTERRYELGDLQRRMRELLAETGLERDPVRERAYGVSHQPRGLNPLSRAAQARERTLKARMADYFDDHFSGDYVSSARRSYASSKDVLSRLRQRTGAGFEVDRRWFASLPREKQRAIAVGVDYGMEVVGGPSKGLLAIRTYVGGPSEYARHQRRKAGYIIELNTTALPGMSPDQLEQVLLHEVAHSASSAHVPWEAHDAETDALIAWTPYETSLPQSRASGIIEEALISAGFGEEVVYSEAIGQLMLSGDLLAYAGSISDYAVEGADSGAQDDELLAEAIRFVANNGYGENPVADAIARRFL